MKYQYLYMKIEIKFIEHGLFHHLADQFDAALPKVFQGDAIVWDVRSVAADFRPEDFLSFPETPSVLLVEACDTAAVRKIHLMENQILALIKRNPDVPFVLSPVIMAFQSPALLINTQYLPDLVTEWMFSPVFVSDLAGRILVSLKRKRMLKARLRFGAFTLIRESHSITYEDRVALLTPSEFRLADLFFSRFGMLISFEELVLFFRLAGKSTQANNIRAGIFQLRLKLDVLTKSQVTVVSVYKQGYCMRNKGERSKVQTMPSLAAENMCAASSMSRENSSGWR
jgi:DNA-binding winged helix-turn-helix (wHTH) protein